MSDTVTRTHSTWLHLVKQPRYFAAVDEVRESYAPGTAERYAAGYHPENEAYAVGGPTQNGPARHDDGGPSAVNPLGKLPGSVWTMTEQEVVERIVKGWSPEGAVVIDPFCTTRPR